jgi:hypothetical protein
VDGPARALRAVSELLGGFTQTRAAHNFGGEPGAATRPTQARVGVTSPGGEMSGLSLQIEHWSPKSVPSSVPTSGLGEANRSSRRFASSGKTSPGQAQVGLRRAHVRVSGSSHQRDRCLAYGGSIRQRGVPEVVEGPDMLGDPSGRQSRGESRPVRVYVERLPLLRVTEDELALPPPLRPKPCLWRTPLVDAVNGSGRHCYLCGRTVH